MSREVRRQPEIVILPGFCIFPEPVYVSHQTMEFSVPGIVFQFRYRPLHLAMTLKPGLQVLRNGYHPPLSGFGGLGFDHDLALFDICPVELEKLRGS